MFYYFYYAYAWARYRGHPRQKLVAQTKNQAKRLRSLEEAKSMVLEAESHAENFDYEERWVSWRKLIELHRIASDQIDRTFRCFDYIKQAKGLKLREDHLKEFLSCFKASNVQPAEESDEVVPDKKKLELLQGYIQCSCEKWSETRQKIQDVQPPVFFAHAFLRLSSCSGIEIASLFIAGLMAIGAAHMAIFFEAAVGSTGLDVSAYWTLDDLLIRGVRVLPYFFVALIAVEAGLYVYRKLSADPGYKPHWLVIRRPVVLVSVFFLAIMMWASWLGYSDGVSDFKEFKKMNSETAQMATVMDGTVLNNVYLVGTTDRTAIFLQARLSEESDDDSLEKWRKRMGKKDLQRGFWRTSIGVWMAFFRDENLEREDSLVFRALRGTYNQLVSLRSKVADRAGLETPEEEAIFSEESAESPSSETRRRDKDFAVLVMDRALIACHGFAEECESAPAREGDEALGRQLQAIEQRLDVFSGEMDGRFSELQPAISDIRRAVGEIPTYLANRNDQYLEEVLQAMGDRWRDTALAPTSEDESS